MTIRYLALAAAFAAEAPAQALTLDERWHSLPQTTEAIYCGLAVADSATTASIIDRGGEERNPLLGRHPSHVGLAALAVGKCAGHAAITSILQDHASARAVRVWEAISIGVQGGVVAHNVGVRLGVRFGF